jgi:integrase/recombinase XerD
MTSAANASAPALPGGKPKKSPLRAATLPRAGNGLGANGGQAVVPRPKRGGLSAADLREMGISEFAAWLRSQTSKLDRPFQEHTITSYTDAAKALDRWMTAQGMDEDFTACDTATLNRFFADYRKSHMQGGTNTLQRNLAHLFAWLEEAYDHPTPYTARLNRYAPTKKRPATLAEEFITDMLEVTGGGRARSFEDVRDHAIIRVFTEGVRLTELAQMEIDDLSADLIVRPFARVVPLKGARAYSEGRIVPFTPMTARAVVAYLRVRRSHRKAELQALWLGMRNRGPMSGSGVYQMLKRRAGLAGYDPIRPHQFRHTFAHDWLEGGGSEGDLMRLMGWTDRSMLDLYAEDLQVERAIEAKRRRGNIY